jgi:hypothetical protein
MTLRAHKASRYMSQAKLLVERMSCIWPCSECVVACYINPNICNTTRAATFAARYIEAHNVEHTFNSDGSINVELPVGKCISIWK